MPHVSFMPIISPWQCDVVLGNLVSRVLHAYSEWSDWLMLDNINSLVFNNSSHVLAFLIPPIIHWASLFCLCFERRYINIYMMQYNTISYMLLIDSALFRTTKRSTHFGLWLYHANAIRMILLLIFLLTLSSTSRSWEGGTCGFCMSILVFIQNILTCRLVFPDVGELRLRKVQ